MGMDELLSRPESTELMTEKRGFTCLHLRLLRGLAHQRYIQNHKQEEAGILVDGLGGNWASKSHLVPVDPELEKPDSVGPKEIDVGVRVWLRAKTPAAQTRGIKTHKRKGLFSATKEAIFPGSRKRGRSFTHRMERRWSARRKPKLAASGKPERNTP